MIGPLVARSFWRGNGPWNGSFLIDLIGSDPMSDSKRDPEETVDAGAMPPVRTAMDASDNEHLRRNPSNEDAKLEVALDETFPSSDAPSNTQPGKGKDPAPSSGYDPAAEAEIARHNL